MQNFTMNSIGVSLIFVLLGCNQPADTEDVNIGSVPLPPYLDVTLTADKMPGFQTPPATLIYDVTFVGFQSQPLISLEGDTAHYLWLYFVTTDDVELLNANADSVWHGYVNLGQTIHLEYEFQFTGEKDDACCLSDLDFYSCHYIYLGARFFTTRQTLAGKDTTKAMATAAGLSFNHISGKYNLTNPYEIYQGGTMP